MVEGDSCKDDNVTGMQLYAVSGIEPKLIMTEGRIAGYLYEAGGKKYGLFGNIKPKDSRLSKKEQAKQVLELMDSTLRSADMDFSNIIRTWFYLNELLKWYKEFNEARNEFFTDHKIFEDLVPASTGIGGKPESKEALVAGMLAIKSTNGIKPAAAVVSPLQCPALNYKSSFSRAVEYSLGGVKKLIISGTASIDKDGNSVYKDDIRKQLWYTMEVVEAILKCRKMTFGDTVRAIAYFRDAVDIPVFEEYCREKKLKDFPFIISNADVCRSDLLFEIELDAVKDN
jgi:enamine deaminase RidA (YjgF/YER057c/UK114 family)